VTVNYSILPFFVVPLVPIPAEQEGQSPKKIKEQYDFIRDRIADKTNEELINDKEALTLFKELGQDQTITTYMFNFYTDEQHTKKNTDIYKMNKLNTKLYQNFSFDPTDLDKKVELVVTSSQFDPNVYGKDFMDYLRGRLGIVGNEDQPIDFIISTIMNPWLSDTVKGSFLPKVIEIIVKNVTEILGEMDLEE
jgi:hypothetical protein